MQFQEEHLFGNTERKSLIWNGRSLVTQKQWKGLILTSCYFPHRSSSAGDQRWKLSRLGKLSGAETLAKNISLADSSINTFQCFCYSTKGRFLNRQ